jgi:hypothetical protein
MRRLAMVALAGVFWSCSSPVDARCSAMTRRTSSSVLRFIVLRLLLGVLQETGVHERNESC